MINWQGLNTGGFQNALATGLQLGGMRRQQEQENALMQQRERQIAMQEQAQQAQAQAAQQKQQGLDRQTYGRLLKMAGDNPQQAFSAAQQMGLDLSGLPQIGTPEFEQWRQTELFVLEALSDPEKLTSVQQDAQALGLDLNTPEGRRAVQELTLYKYAKQGVDEYGRPTLELPQIAIGAPGVQDAGGVPILPRSARPAGMTDDQLFEAARRKVEAGAPVEPIFRQLREWGVEVN